MTRPAVNKTSLSGPSWSAKLAGGALLAAAGAFFRMTRGGHRHPLNRARATKPTTHSNEPRAPKVFNCPEWGRCDCEGGFYVNCPGIENLRGKP